MTTVDTGESSDYTTIASERMDVCPRCGENGYADKRELQDISARVHQHLNLSAEEKEAGIEPIFRELAEFTARALANRPNT